MVFPRFLFPKIKRMLKAFPVLLLTGPRQSGKSTLMNKLASELNHKTVSLDRITTQIAAINDPTGFINGLEKPAFLDEVQRAIDIFLPIKVDVDEHRSENGRYMLTGSANPLLVPKLGDALTGRMVLLQLWPLSQGELEGKQETFLETIFSEKIGYIETIQCSKVDLVKRLVLGGFPGLIAQENGEGRREWCDSYISLALEKDIQQLAHIEGFTHLPNLLQIIAARIGSTLNYSSLGQSSGIATSTLRRYMQLLESLFLLHTIPAWSKNFEKRLVKSPKAYFVDTALLLYFLNMTETRLLENPQILGTVLENFVINEICKQITWNPKRVQIFHCRFSDNQAKVDIILENEDGKIVGIEIKSSETIGPEDFRHFTKLREVVGKDFLRGIVLYAGSEKLPFGKDQWAMPISSLWK